MQQGNEKPKASVPVSVNVKVVGSTATAALKPRGGEAAASPTNTDTGFVANRRSTAPGRTRDAPRPSPPPPPAAPPKKAAKLTRPSIGTTGEPNSNEGFTGGSGSGSTGELGLDARHLSSLERASGALGPPAFERLPAGTIGLHGAIAQLGERLDRTQEVSGSSPLSSTQE